MGNKIIKSESKIEDYVDVKSNLDSDYKSHVYDNNDNNNNDNNYYEMSLYSYILEVYAYLFNEDVKYNKETDCDYILFHKLQPSYFIGDTFIGIKDSKYIITLWETFEIKDFYKNNNEYIINMVLNDESPILLKLSFYDSGCKIICISSILHFLYSVKSYFLDKSN